MDLTDAWYIVSGVARTMQPAVFILERVLTSSCVSAPSLVEMTADSCQWLNHAIVCKCCYEKLKDAHVIPRMGCFLGREASLKCQAIDWIMTSHHEKFLEER